ncbi:DHA2 family efflux MFS transporter permease subunit [Alkalibacillus haloalkaliphilus]|uniref:DHA2 family efflux MFS transporter permease subunit n=1 Tax=Alkalibacillus haloalkaliphilus TaxID=94136 RepID=UPI0029356E4C|nr:DHA2 family efflux MFS transporter permease subunit [Alkalibacillus haloalkaliphilus]MDV2581637.1 DHA2 family efflux MFS transporter permease subunit [Alkalibacillus haloalkaliphilus]
MSKLPNKWLVVLSVLFGTFTVILNNSMLNPVLPEFMHIFDSDAVGVSWILTIFMIAMGMTMPLTGYLGDRFGKKTIYIVGVLLFTFASILGAMSQTLSMIIIARAIQGIAGGLMMPNAMALIFNAFPKNERGFAVGTYGISVMIAPAIGPTVGGVIAESFNWIFLFLVNLPFALLSLFFSIKYLKPTPSNPSIRFDYIGFIMVTLGVGSVLYVLGQGRELEALVSLNNALLLVVGIILIIVFVKYELRKEQPLLNLRVFKIKTYRYSIFVTSASSIGLFSGLFLIPYMIQEAFELGMIATGLIFLPSALMSGLFMNIGGKLLDKKGPRVVIPTGLAILSGASLAFGFIELTTAFWVIVVIYIVHGAGLGFGNMPATTAGMNKIPEHLVAQGSAMNNLIRQFASSLGIVFFSVYYELRRGHMILLDEYTVQEATLQAINEAFIIAAVIIALAIPAALKMKGVEDEEE